MKEKILILLITFIILFFGLIASLRAIEISTSKLIKEFGPVKIRTGRFKIKGEEVVKINSEISRVRSLEGGIILISNSRFKIFE